MIKIWRPPHVAFSANILVKKLRSMGEKVSIVPKIDPYDKSLYIIYNASSVKKLPANYIVYQTEVVGSKWFTSRYEWTLRNAIAVWEYDPNNISEYHSLNSNISVVSPGYEAQDFSVSKEIPLLFYGHIRKSKIREHILDNLKREVDIVVVENEHMKGMWDTLSRTSIVLNLHYYANAPLEAFRINEAISFGCHVISQRSPKIPEKYKEIVSFADSSDDVIKLINEFSEIGVPRHDQMSLNGLSNDKEVELAMNRPMKLRRPKVHMIKQLFTGKLLSLPGDKNKAGVQSAIFWDKNE